MARIEGQKLKILVLADILARETDSAHGLTVPQLIAAAGVDGDTPSAISPCAIFPALESPIINTKVPSSFAIFL